MIKDIADISIIVFTTMNNSMSQHAQVPEDFPDAIPEDVHGWCDQEQEHQDDPEEDLLDYYCTIIDEFEEYRRRFDDWVIFRPDNKKTLKAFNISVVNQKSKDRKYSRRKNDH